MGKFKNAIKKIKKVEIANWKNDEYKIFLEEIDLRDLIDIFGNYYPKFLL